MATNDPRSPVAAGSRAALTPAPEPRHVQLSVEDAELFASKIRPSWELFDDAMRGDLAADLAAPAQGAPSDTIIEGVPTMVIGPAAGDADAPTTRLEPDQLPTLALDPLARAALAKPAQGAVIPAPAAGAPSKVKTTVGDADAQPQAKGRPLGPPPKGSNTRVGLGDEPAKAKPPASGPSSRRAVRTAAAAPAPVSGSSRATPSAVPADDVIEIPVNGASSGSMLKIGLGAVALIAVLGIGYAVMGRGKAPAETAPTAAAKATAAPTSTIVPPPLEPVPTATVAAPTAIVAPTASAAATVAPTVTVAPTASAAPKATVAAKEPPPKPVAAAEPKKPPRSSPPPPPPPKKGGGGIIRESPF